MNFHPEVNETIQLFGQTYSFMQHPATLVVDIPYGQEGRQGIVYQMADEECHHYYAYKVFKERFASEHLRTVVDKIKPFESLYGLSVCGRSIVLHEGDCNQLDVHPELRYSLLMPWIPGPSWADIVLEKRSVAKEDSLYLGCMLAYILKEMEQQHLAHCDLSSSNILLPYFSHQEVRSSFAPLEFVDVEELYAPDLKRPRILPTGSPGYAPSYGQEGIWGEHSDRFSGAVLLAEILTWHDVTIRQQADEASYFNPKEMQQKSDRLTYLSYVLRETLGPNAEALFLAVWNSRTFEECPSFSDWFDLFPSELQKQVLEQREKQKKQKEVAIEPNQVLKLADAFEGIGKPQIAILEYAYLYRYYPAFFKDHVHLSARQVKDVSLPHAQMVSEYIEAGRYFESIDELQLALLFYDRAAKLPGISPSVQYELVIIAKGIRSELQKSNHKPTPEAILENLLKEEGELHEEDEVTYEIPKHQGVKEKVKQWTLKRKKWLTIGISVVFLFSVAFFSYSFYSQKKWNDYIDQGTEAFLKKDYHLAEQLLQQAIEIKPTEGLYTKVATIYLTQEEYQKTIRYLDALQFDKAISESNQEAYYLMGRAYFLLKDYPNAVYYYEIALKGKKSVYKQDVIRDLVISYAKTKEMSKASGLINQLNPSRPKDKAFAHYLKGEILQIEGNDLQATDEYKQAVALDKNLVRATENLVDLYLKRNRTKEVDDQTKATTYEEAIQLMNERLEKESTNVSYLNRLGQLYYDYALFNEAKGNDQSRNLLEQALITYKKMLDLGIQNEEVSLNIGVIYDKVGQVTEAEAAFRETVNQYPSSGHAHFVYGLFKIKQQQYEEAATLLGKVVSLNQNESEVNISNQKIQEMKTKGIIR